MHWQWMRLVTWFQIKERVSRSFRATVHPPSAETKEMLKTVLNGHRGTAVMQRAAKALADAKVLEPWNIVIKGAGGEHKVNGLSKLNEKALNALTDDQFLLLRQSGALAIAYAQLISINQLPLLKRLSEMHTTFTANQAEHAKLFSSEGSNVDENLDLQALFEDT